MDLAPYVVTPADDCGTQGSYLDISVFKKQPGFLVNLALEQHYITPTAQPYSRTWVASNRAVSKTRKSAVVLSLVTELTWRDSDRPEDTDENQPVETL